MGLFRRIQPNFGGGTFRGGCASEISFRRSEKPQTDIFVLRRGTESRPHCWDVHYYESWLCRKDRIA